MKVDVMNWHIDSAMRIGRRRGSQPILVRFTSYAKKIERNSKFSGDKYKDRKKITVWRLEE
jgi:hypothetical protein